MKIKLKAQSYVAITIVTGAFIPILVESANHTNLFGFFMLISLISMLTGVTFLFATGGINRLIEVVRSPRSFGLSVLMGFLIFLPIESGIAYAERFVSASLATVLFRTSPLLMLPLLPLMLREKLTKYQIIALLLAFIGIYIAATGGTLTSIFVTSNTIVVVFLIALAFIYAISTIMIKKYMIDMGSLLTVAAAALFVLFASLYFWSGGGAINLSIAAFASMIFLGVGSNFLFYYMYFVGLRILKTTVVTNLISLSPFFTFIFASVLLGERILPYYIVIAVLVGAGILIQHFDKVGGTYLARVRHKKNRFVVFDVSGAFITTREFAINSAIRHGGRVLALKLDRRYANKLEALTRDGNYSAVFTDGHRGIAAELDFVREILGAGDGHIVVMKAGPTDECERFFDELSDILESSENKIFMQGTK